MAEKSHGYRIVDFGEMIYILEDVMVITPYYNFDNY